MHITPLGIKMKLDLSIYLYCLALNLATYILLIQHTVILLVASTYMSQ